METLLINESCQPGSSDAVPTTPGHVFLYRTAKSFEVAVTKIFTGAFAWQGAALLAVYAGHGTTSVSFACSTGIGDALGVFIGHVSLSVLARAGLHACCCSVGQTSRVEISHGVIVGLWLASGSALSGSVWQPVLNLTRSLGFTAAALLTGLFTALAFVAMLRLGRDIYGTLLGWDQSVPPGNRGNCGADLTLGVSILGALGLFCSTDGTLEGNWAAIFTISDDDSAFAGMVKAGSSGATGFMACQLVQNVLLPHGRSYLDS